MSSWYCKTNEDVVELKVDVAEKVFWFVPIFYFRNDKKISLGTWLNRTCIL